MKEHCQPFGLCYSIDDHARGGIRALNARNFFDCRLRLLSAIFDAISDDAVFRPPRYREDTVFEERQVSCSQPSVNCEEFAIGGGIAIVSTRYRRSFDLKESDSALVDDTVVLVNNPQRNARNRS